MEKSLLHLKVITISMEWTKTTLLKYFANQIKWCTATLLFHKHSARNIATKKHAQVEKPLSIKHWPPQKLTVVQKVSPYIRTKFASCWGHPFTRVVDILANLPTGDVLHYFSLIFKILLPLLHESKERKTNMVWSHSYTESKRKKNKTHKYRKYIGGCQRQGVGIGEVRKGSQKVKPSVIK